MAYKKYESAHRLDVFYRRKLHRDYLRSNARVQAIQEYGKKINTTAELFGMNK